MFSTPPPLPPKQPPSPVVHSQPPQGRTAIWIVFLVLGIFLGAIVIIAILAAIATPAYNRIRQNAMMTKSISNLRQINMGLGIYATDFDGKYPADLEGRAFSSSQEAFNGLIPDYIDTEMVFWAQTREPNHLRPPREDGILDKGECIYGYAAGQTDQSHPTSPLVFEGFLNRDDLSCTEYMPYLSKRKALVGFVDGSVSMMPLTSSSEGATIKSEDGRINNIFETRENGGYLDTEKEKVALPIGY